MRYVFKTSYDQDINLARDGAQRSWYAALLIMLLGAPLVLSDYWLSQLTFIYIYGTVGVGLMLLTGFTGQFSIGHAAFMGVGAYTEAYLLSHAWPFPLSMLVATMLSAAVGVVVGLPALRVKGLYLGFATLAFGFIIEEVMSRWESVTGGNAGRYVPPPSIGGIKITGSAGLYFLCLACAIGGTLVVRNLLRAHTGRAFVAIRDSEISAQSMGITLAHYKAASFAISAALAGLGGALYAHAIQFLSPEQFGFIQSIDLLLMIIIGGLGSLHGVYFGAAFLIGMPQIISITKDVLPPAMSQAAGLQSVLYGIVLIAVVMLEPTGMYGRWLKLRTWLELYPFYRRGMFKRQRSFQRSERFR
ncbi:branched-chain amino acid ABC transporter permease [Bradyrhizobium liaoningense]